MSFCPRAGSRGGGGGGGARRASWPGWAPCWRHEEFPYLTVSEVSDAEAGVRVVARQCFMMEALSAFVQPKISVESGKAVRARGEDGDGDEPCQKEEEEEEQQQEEARFTDEMWGELMGKGTIAGDERWIVGEDREGKVTIVRF